MRVGTFSITEPWPDDYETFVDGDLFVVNLPKVVDHSFYSELSRLLDEHRDVIQQILFDCSSVETIGNTGLKEFIKLSTLAKERSLRLILLDASNQLSGQLCHWLSHAVWAESTLAAEVERDR